MNIYHVWFSWGDPGVRNINSHILRQVVYKGLVGFKDTKVVSFHLNIINSWCLKIDIKDSKNISSHWLTNTDISKNLDYYKRIQTFFINLTNFIKNRLKNFKIKNVLNNINKETRTKSKKIFVYDTCYMKILWNFFVQIKSSNFLKINISREPEC